MAAPSSAAGNGRQPPAPTQREAGIWRGRRIARVFSAPSGRRVLVGLNARANDLLSLRLAAPHDYFLHVAGQPGSHVIVLNPNRAGSLDRETLRFAASLAAAYSSARAGGRVAVHCARCSDVSKPRGLEPGKVTLRRHTTVFAEPDRHEEACEGS